MSATAVPVTKCPLTAALQEGVLVHALPLYSSEALVGLNGGPAPAFPAATIPELTHVPDPHLVPPLEYLAVFNV